MSPNASMSPTNQTQIENATHAAAPIAHRLPIQPAITAQPKDLFMGLVKAAWEEAVGDFVARHSQPVGVNRKVLLVQVLQPAVHYTLERMKGQILERLQARFGKDHIRDIRFRIA